jgi:hypothetical protein
MRRPVTAPAGEPEATVPGPDAAVPGQKAARPEAGIAEHGPPDEALDRLVDGPTTAAGVETLER